MPALCRNLSGGATSLPDDPAPLALGRSAPDALLFTTRQGVLEAGDTYPTVGTHGLGLQRVVIVVGIEDARLESPARPQLAPDDLRG